jgi:invasion protein IalB
MNRTIMHVRPAMLAGGLLLAAIQGAAAATPAASAPVPTLAPDAAVEGPRLTTQSFGAWTYRCQETMVDGKPGHSACEIVQDVTVQQDGKTQSVMSIAVGISPEGKGHFMTALLPLGVRLKPGMRLGVDDGALQTVAYDYCGPRGCWVVGVPVEPSLAAMKAGKNGIARLVQINGRDVTIEFPLTGFAPALAALDGNREPGADAAKPADAKAKPKK